jgi:hypothetical protein
MRRHGVTLVALAILLLVGGCVTQGQGEGAGQNEKSTVGIMTTVSGAKRFDHFTITNMTDDDITATVDLWIDDPTGAKDQTMSATVKAHRIGGDMRQGNNRFINVVRALCTVKVNGTVKGTCNIRHKPDSSGYLFLVNSANFYFFGDGKLSGTAFLIKKSDGKGSRVTSYK